MKEKIRTNQGLKITKRMNKWKELWKKLDKKGAKKIKKSNAMKV